MQVQIYVCGWKETRQQSINYVLPKVKFKKSELESGEEQNEKSSVKFKKTRQNGISL